MPSAPVTTLERDTELAHVTAALHAAAGGAGGLLLIEGPPGIGKSRLVEDARALAKSLGFVRMRAIGDEPEAGLAWGVVRQLVSRSVLRYSGETRAAILAGPAGAALEALDAAPDDLAGADAALARALHALWWVAADLSSERPLLITVDDAQWADEPSLRFLVYLAHRLEDLSVTLIVATRPPELATGPLADLCSGRTGERLLPGPLSAAAVATLAGGREEGVDPAVAGALHAASGGNPFYAEQLLAELRREGYALGEAASAPAVAALGPRTVSRSLLLRLGPEATALAGAAAVLGIRSDPALAAELAGLDAAASARGAGQLRAEHVLAAGELELTFVHPVLRESVLAEVDAATRARLHADAALALQAAGGDRERVAEHLVMAPAGTLPDATALLRPVAATALARGDAATAVRLLRHALAVDPADEALRCELGLALLRTGGQVEAKALLRAAVAAADDDAERARRLGGLAEAIAGADGLGAAAEELRTALDDGVVSEPGARLALEAHMAIVASFLLDGIPGSGARLEAFAGLPGDTCDELKLLALVAQRRLNLGLPQTLIRPIAQRAAAAVPTGPLTGQTVFAWGMAVHALGAADGIDAAAAALAAARRTQAAGGLVEGFMALATLTAQLHWRTGDLRSCESETSAGLAARRMHEPGPQADGMTATLVRFAVLSALERGAIDEAEQLLATHAPAPDRSSVPVSRLGHAYAALALARDEPETALTEALRLRDTEAAAGAENPTVPWRLLAAQALLRLGRDAEATTLADESIGLAERWGGAREIGAALRMRARVDPAHRVEHLERAVALLQPSPARLELAGALCDLGDALRVARRPTDAREPLHRGADLAREIAAVALFKRALASLETLGEHRRDLPRAGIDALTAGERRVAGLAARGRTNRDIARELFVTPKTVENHLGRVYSKLGVGGRRELVGVLAGS